MSIEEQKTEEKKKVYTGESCHWYTVDGEPVFEVFTADGKKKRPTNLRDARKMGLLPSVTTVFKLMEKPAVSEWKLNELLKTVQRTGITGDGLPTWEYKNLLLSHCQESMDAGRDEGTEIHKAVEQYLEYNDESTNPKHRLIALRVKDLIATLMNGELFEVECERTGVNTFIGVAGTCDLLAISDKQAVICDLKTTSDKHFSQYCTKPYPEWIMQLAVYKTFIDPLRLGMRDMRYVSIIVNRDNGEVGHYEWTKENAGKALTAFINLIAVYKYMKNL